MPTADRRRPTAGMRRLTLVAVNVLVFVFVAELVAVALHLVRHGTLFYLDPPRYAPLPETERRTLTADRLHPYFGPTHAPGHPFGRSGAKTNNFGFVSPHDYPYLRSAGEQLLIGIFGGSVGVWFCEQGAGRLVERLEQSGLFPGRRLVPLCFSHEGYKQPQQLLVLTYFLSIGQPFDLVINIDGFNEVALGSLNDQAGLDVSMPSRTHLEPLINVIDQSTLTPEKLQSLAAIRGYKERMNALAARISRTRLAFVSFVLTQYYERLSKQYRAELVRFANLPANPEASSIVYATPRVAVRQGPRVFQDIVAQWVSASTLMHDLLAARGTPYFHFLQPNQYHTSRPFDAAEARVALNEASPFKAGVEQGYPLLVSASASLQERGIRSSDATHVFDAERGAVYMDDCCHYTPLGNRLLADFIADRVIGSLRR